MSTCPKLCIYLTVFSCIVLILSAEVMYNTTLYNCTSRSLSAGSLTRKGSFPNPQLDIAECGRNCTKSWICDPGHIIPSQKADELDVLIETVAKSGKCTCSNCTDADGHNIAIALVPSTTAYHGVVAGDFPSFLLASWKFQKCNNNVVIVLSRDDKKVYTETGANTGEVLTRTCIKEVHDKIKYKLKDGEYYEVLKRMINQYKLILSLGNCDYIAEARTRTIAAIATGASFGMAVLLFSLIALVRGRKDGLCVKTSEDGVKYLADTENSQTSRPCYHSNHSYEGHSIDQEEEKK